MRLQIYPSFVANFVGKPNHSIVVCCHSFWQHWKWSALPFFFLRNCWNIWLPGIKYKQNIHDSVMAKSIGCSHWVYFHRVVFSFSWVTVTYRKYSWWNCLIRLKCIKRFLYIIACLYQKVFKGDKNCEISLSMASRIWPISFYIQIC